MGLSERFLLTGVSFLLSFLWLIKVMEPSCCSFGSSLLRKESGRVFVVLLQLDVPVRDIDVGYINLDI